MAKGGSKGGFGMIQQFALLCGTLSIPLNPPSKGGLSSPYRQS
ncbi:hypothetical protein MC7420_6567 [Coleofasciculus chthonoplastes PCC 7420]|uniref:Uncharacterized protein n=1 Tax=Coleofasciculus chthonoplastes PCC 7420 TaxID=118168 RepID=B4W599_9CYAN|nr:hypothetical protein MC7420_6567 [Coleofasciculus chthonoplastes PCC 7420]